jgi:streptogramin lyase
MWRGPPLSEVTLEPFAHSEIARLEGLRIAAVEERVDAELALGRHATLVPELEAFVRANPLRERLWAQLMLALYRSGRQAAALDAYQQARRELLEQVGLEPGPDLRRLEKAILTHDPSLAPAQSAIPVTRRVRVTRRRLLTASAALAAVVIAGVAVLVTRGSSSAALAAISHDSIGIVDPQRNALIGEIRLQTRPAAIAFGAGSLWVATYDRHTLLRIDPRTREVRDAIGLGSQPTAIAVGDGYVWVLCGPAYLLFQFDAERKSLVRKHSLSREIRVRPNRGLPYAPLGVGFGEPFDLAAGAGGAWVGYAHAVSRVDAATGEVKQIRVGSNGGIGFGEQALWTVGQLWFDSQQKVSRIDPETRNVTERIPPANVGAERGFGAPIAGAGAVWAISEAARLAWKVNPDIGRVSDVIPLYHGPVDVAVGEGAVWTANDDGTVSRIDPKTATLARTIPLGDYPRTAYPVQLAAGGGVVWVAVH